MRLTALKLRRLLGAESTGGRRAAGVKRGVSILVTGVG